MFVCMSPEPLFLHSHNYRVVQITVLCWGQDVTSHTTSYTSAANCWGATFPCGLSVPQIPSRPYLMLSFGSIRTSGRSFLPYPFPSSSVIRNSEATLSTSESLARCSFCFIRPHCREENWQVLSGCRLVSQSFSTSKPC